MKLLGNIIWLIFGGLMVAIEYFVMGVAFFITIIGIPFGLQCFKLGVLAIWPFGSRIENSETASGCVSTVLNIIWIVTGGIIISLTHLFWGILLCITIIGIPFGKQHFKMMALAFTPFGKRIV